MLRRLFVAISWVTLATRFLAAQAPAGQEGFVPVTSLPPAQQLPAAPYLICAYAFIWVGAMVYLWSIWHRLGKVEQEMRVLEQRSHRGAKG
jgi:CcmD family protein